MKDKKNIDLVETEAPADVYNQMRTKKPASGFEAKRTLEALSAIKGHQLLIKKIKEEKEWRRMKPS